MTLKLEEAVRFAFDTGVKVEDFSELLAMDQKKMVVLTIEQIEAFFQGKRDSFPEFIAQTFTDNEAIFNDLLTTYPDLYSQPITSANAKMGQSLFDSLTKTGLSMGFLSRLEALNVIGFALTSIIKDYLGNDEEDADLYKLAKEITESKEIRTRDLKVIKKLRGFVDSIDISQLTLDHKDETLP